ncbi:protease complex subunit PrcB family protein [Flavobacterium alkalisoli]|uniref:protease complex subunit PrcB family protein n=1 Tax=Flavobacterium alkalisoli TaxID=2602769 RepID=UPI003A939201
MKKLALLSILFLLVSCVTHQKGEDGKPGKSAMANNYEILTESGYGGHETAFNEVITSQERLDELYRELNIESIPTVDFDNNNVVALFMGQKPSGGYSIGIDNVKIENKTAFVKVKTTKPKAGENVTMALMQPYCIATITKTNKVTFE